MKIGRRDGAATLLVAAIVGRDAFRGTWGVAAAFFAVESAALGTATFIRAEEGALSDGLLAVFVAAIVVAWALAELVRTHLVRTSAGRPAH